MQISPSNSNTGPGVRFETKVELLTEDNYLESYLRFEQRQAGVSVVYSHEDDCYYYNAYCMDMKVLKELLTLEFDFLSDALEFVNSEFSSWELVQFDQKGCSSCAAK